MTDWEYNAQVEKSRAEYHKKRAEESPAYKAVYDSFMELYVEAQENGGMLCAAIQGSDYTEEKKMVRHSSIKEISFIQYLEAMIEYGKAEEEFDKKLIKKNGFEW